MGSDRDRVARVRVAVTPLVWLCALLLQSPAVIADDIDLASIALQPAITQSPGQGRLRVIKFNDYTNSAA